MSIITANNISKSFGNVEIFSNVSFSVPLKSRMGLVGPNGSGKSTLLHILTGRETSDSGAVYFAKNIKIGFLPQNIVANFDCSPYELCLNNFSNLLQMREKIHSLEQKLSNDSSPSLLESYGDIQTLFEHSGGYTFENEIHRTLQGLNITGDVASRPWAQLSGGQKTRAFLANLLLSNPDVLILDEPTNYLDIAAIEWLEAYLKSFAGAVLLVSHDRYFLDQTVEKILELDSTFNMYRGNYSDYLNQREERYELELKKFEEQQAFIESEEEYIRRNIAGQNTRQAQGRRKRLERLISESKITRPKSANKIKISLSTDQRSGDIVLRTKELKIGYHDDKQVLFSVPDLALLRGECASIIGPNGTGKSTFLKTLLSSLPPLNGSSELGANITIGYFSQTHEKLDPELDLIDTISSFAPKLLPAEIRKYLAKFLFTGDDVFKKVKVLSGGETGRLSLAILSISGANLLLLDEPMNHLDVEAQEILQSVLKEFSGTIILVSHDRYLIDAIATQIWEIPANKKEMVVFAGSYSQYKEFCKANESAFAKKNDGLVERKNQNKPARDNNNYEIRKLEKRISEIEKDINEKEIEIQSIEKEMLENESDYVKISSLGLMYNKTQNEIEDLYRLLSNLYNELPE